jgi:hypothetical protein
MRGGVRRDRSKEEDLEMNEIEAWYIEMGGKERVRRDNWMQARITRLMCSDIMMRQWEAREQAEREWAAMSDAERAAIISQ